MLLFFLCFCSRCWVSQYFEVGLIVHIAVENIDRHEAATKIREAADRLVPEFEFEIVDPLVGTYTPCPLTSGNQSTPDFEAEKVVVLTPGTKIFSERMEPAGPGEMVLPGCALYSCSVQLQGSIERGLTVGHLFENVGLECKLLRNDPSTLVSVGRCRAKIAFIDLVDSLRKTTADLALLDVFCRAENTLVINDVSYLLKLCQGLSNSEQCLNVAILSSNGQIRYGQLVSTLFTISAQGLFNTLSVVDPDNGWSRVNSPGDSGALVISVPDPRSSNEVLVYGMVIGYFESDDRLQSTTVATRLWDVLNYVNKMSPLQLTAAPFESGYVSTGPC